MRGVAFRRGDVLRAWLVIGLWICSAWPECALAQNFTVSIANAPALQDIVTGTTSTTFTVSDAGAVTVSPTSTTAAVRLKSGSVVVPTLTVTCARQGAAAIKDCQGSSLTIRITAGTATGGGNLGAITCATGQAQPTGVTYSCANGSSAGTAYREIVYTYGAAASVTGWTSTLKLGLSLIVSASATRGATSVPVLCTRISGASDSFATGGCGSIVSARILRSIAVAKVSDLRFGTLVRGAGTIAVTAAGSRSATGQTGIVPGSVGSAAQFDVTGEGGQAITVTVPASFDLTNGSSTLKVTTSNDLPGGSSAQTLSGSIGTDSTLRVGVGGSLTLSPNTPSGNYTGSLTVTASYQ